MPPRSPEHDHPAGIMDCQDAQQHVVQGAGWALRSTGFRVRLPDAMNEILRDIPPRPGTLPIQGPTRGSPEPGALPLPVRSALGATTWEGGVPGIEHLRRDRRFSLSSTPFPLPLFKMDADVADKGDAGWELTLSADCGLRTENGGSGKPCHASIWPGPGEWDSSDP